MSHLFIFFGTWFLTVNLLGAMLVLMGNAETERGNKESEIFKWLVAPGIQLATVYQDTRNS